MSFGGSGRSSPAIVLTQRIQPFMALLHITANGLKSIILHISGQLTFVTQRTMRLQFINLVLKEQG